MSGAKQSLIIGAAASSLHRSICVRIGNLAYITAAFGLTATTPVSSTVLKLPTGITADGGQDMLTVKDSNGYCFPLYISDGSNQIVTNVNGMTSGTYFVNAILLVKA